MSIIRWGFMVVLISSLFMLIGCKSKGKKDPFQDQPAETIYQTGTKALKKEQYAKATEAYESLDRQYPFGIETEKAHLNIIYVYYRRGEIPAALRAADRFIRLHPNHPDVDYAYYMRGLIKSSEGVNFVARYVPLDLTQRDIDYERKAFEYFKEFLERFPDSRYAPDARQRMIAIRNHLAQHELNVARYYLDRKAYLAAANRAQTIIESYPQTPSSWEALSIMTESYEALKLEKLAEHSRKVLNVNQRQEKLL